MKKELLVIIITSVFIICLPWQVFAHPGSLDSNGGHHVRATGEYHYHSGENQDNNAKSLDNTYKILPLIVVGVYLVYKIGEKISDKMYDRK